VRREAVTAPGIVALGEPLYELNRRPDGLYLPGFGGDTLNVAIAAARLGARAAYVTRLGGDVFGDELAALMQREGLDTSGVARDPDAPTGLYFVTHGASGHVFTYRRAGSAASLMRPGDIAPQRFSGVGFFHASGISQAISDSAAETVASAIGLARAAGARVSFDTNYRPRLWPVSRARPAIARAAAAAHVLKTSAEDCEALIGTGDPAAIAGHFLGLGAEAVIVTLGAEGVALATAAERCRLPGFRVAAVDATGAGDAFTGALLAELIRGEPLAAAARFANAAAALSTLGYGAIAPLPDRAAVTAFLEAQPPVG